VDPPIVTRTISVSDLQSCRMTLFL
jgi:hypothetical protein